MRYLNGINATPVTSAPDFEDECARGAYYAAMYEAFRGIPEVEGAMAFAYSDDVAGFWVVNEDYEPRPTYCALRDAWLSS